MELLVVVAILSILATLAIPSYQKTMEEARSNEARVNLSVVHMGQKIYYLNNNSSYWDPGGNTTVGAVNTALNVDTTAQYYGISNGNLVIDADNGASPKRYHATFKREGDNTKWYGLSYKAGDAAPNFCDSSTTANPPCAYLP